MTSLGGSHGSILPYADAPREATVPRRGDRRRRVALRAEVVAQTPGEARHEVHERVRLLAPVLELVLAADRGVRDQRARGADRLGREPQRVGVDERQVEHLLVPTERAKRQDPPAEVAGPTPLPV